MINEDQLWSIANRMSEAADKAARAAESMAQSTQKMTELLDPGYGGNAAWLAELLKIFTDKENSMTKEEAQIIALQIKTKAIETEVTAMRLYDEWRIHACGGDNLNAEGEYLKRVTALNESHDEIMRLAESMK